ncbi:MAG TPA: FtsQ-type POTRA domain-containing protein [Rhizomicrobium sp.]|nr:FtsQ-type POTRA domain-containing protein [Rhizomicrobium sp.]
MSRAQPARRRRGDDGPGVIRRFYRALLAYFSWRNPVVWLLACICFVILAGALIASGFVSRTGQATRHTVNQIMTDAGFGIGSVHISGNHRTSPDDILTAVGFAPGESIFGVDVQAARRHLLSLEWVADAEVRRQYPDLITISLVEKLPFALWETANGTYVVERSGRTVGLFDPHAFPHLPKLVGDGAPQSAAELVDAVIAHRATAARVVGYARVSGRRWNLLLSDDVVVKLPEEGWRKQLDLLEQLIVDKAILERDISEIDLREPDNYIFLLRDGQKQQVARGNAA